VQGLARETQPLSPSPPPQRREQQPLSPPSRQPTDFSIPDPPAAYASTVDQGGLTEAGVDGATDAPEKLAEAADVAAAEAAAAAERARRTLGGDQLFDFLCVLIFTLACGALWRLDAGAMYFWLKDLTQEFLKLSIIYSSLEILDKILCSFGVDTLEALSATCTLYTTGDHQRGRARHLAADTAVAALLVSAHAVILMCQGMAFSVAMNSKRANAMVALLIASNFAEIKGVVLKRFDPRRLLILSYQDIVERFHLLIALAFVVAEDMAAAGRWAPDRRLLHNCAYFFGFEIIIDVTKHAVVGKFNEVRPGMYREFMRDVAGAAADAQSHSAHRVVAFEPLAPAALALRIAATLAAIRGDSWADTSWGRAAAVAAWGAAAWGAALAVKLLLGFAVKRAAAAYVQHFDAHSGAHKNRGGVASKGGAPAHVPALSKTRVD